MKVLVINPGSTSTKVAVYEDGKQTWVANEQHSPAEISVFAHVNEQLAYREDTVRRMLAKAGIPLEFDAVMARGGLLQPTPGGVYAVDDALIHDLIYARMEHVCNLGALIADKIAKEVGCPAFIADPEVVDEFMPEARVSGIPEIERISIFHALNQKAVARKYARENGVPYSDLNLIVVHLGGGISVGAHLHGKVVDVNNALNGDGPFSPERAGTVPADQLVDLCFSGKYTQREIKKMLNGRGGLAAHLGITDMREISARATEGLEPYKSMVEAMAYAVGKEVGSRAVALRGNIDAIILTGGIARDTYFVDLLRSWIEWIGPIVLIPGEDEMGSLATNAFGAIDGSLPVMYYRPEHPCVEHDIAKA
ncbi:MAG: butyrate kinase [Muribaculaceae bacterium]|nr:butyrate kinase [Muribaculaceae bacterium]MDE7031824.1 butyrate kinase [Muribaculaceae bacterium]